MTRGHPRMPTRNGGRRHLLPRARMRVLRGGLLLGALAGAAIQAADLKELFEEAERRDPRYRQQQAARETVEEERAQALAGLRPDVSLRANASASRQDIESEFFGARDLDAESYDYRLQLRQPVFRRDRFIRLSQAGDRIDRAEAELAAAWQGLLLRVADAYFSILAARDNLKFVRAEKRSLQRQLEQARQRFEVGLSTIADVEEAQAGFDQAAAAELLAVNELDNARERLREIIGRYSPPLAALAEDMPLRRPQPDNIEAWVELALASNPGLEADRQAVEQARAEVERQRSGHYPTLDLVGSYGFQSSEGAAGQTDVETAQVGLEFDLPLYQGGRTRSQVRQASGDLRSANEDLERRRREVQRGTREAFLGIASGIGRVKALAQAVRSNRTALRATRAGFEVGTRTSVDVVASERALSAAQRDYAQARYDYILNVLRLKQATGILARADLEEFNRWLRPLDQDKEAAAEEEIDTPSNAIPDSGIEETIP